MSVIQEPLPFESGLNVWRLCQLGFEKREATTFRFSEKDALQIIVIYQ